MIRYSTRNLPTLSAGVNRRPATIFTVKLYNQTFQVFLIIYYFNVNTKRQVGPFVILFGRTRVKTLGAGGVLRATREQEAGRSRQEERLKTND